MKEPKPSPKRNTIIPYNPKLRAHARELRRNGTLGEVLLWRAIKGRALGVEFHRQVPVDQYIVDFFCHERRLAVEVDGSSHDHDETYEYDMHRQEALEQWGIRFLRFTEKEVRENLVGIVETITDWLKEDGGRKEEV